MKKTYPELARLAKVIGRELRAAREDRGWTQEQLADAVHVGRAAISNFETGDVNPSLLTFVHLATALNMRPNALLENAVAIFEQRYGTNLVEALKVSAKEPASRPHRPRKTTTSARKSAAPAARRKPSQKS